MGQPEPGLGSKWHHLSRCDSTNDEAMARGREGAPHGTVVTADMQACGRGRLGRRWYSPPGENLYLSVVLRPPLLPPQAPFLTLCAGVALAEATRTLLGAALPPGSTPARVELKWPNDLLLAPAAPEQPLRKAGGILTELVCTSSAIDFVVVGIGCNLLSTAFPSELAATSLRLMLGEAATPGTLAARPFAESLLGHLQIWYGRYLSEGAAPVLAGFLGYAGMIRRGEPLSVRNGNHRLRGVPLGLDEAGALLLRDPYGQIHRVVAGELTPVDQIPLGPVL